ncbi:hypothetical protein B9G79_04270 [Bdellovibrio bacteriovorus]|uniref:Uncharacterized protein n=1 Tax=Bdellovibrio bacteriovorus TaxID=959 RepID=A0A1Z3N5U3_BDEBC|nr:hypothetical protein B9G79_04270 [Bdellovibrio bacteriovorus]
MRAVASALHLSPFDQPWFPVFGGGERGVGFEAVRFWKFLLRIFKFEKGSPAGPFFVWEPAWVIPWLAFCVLGLWLFLCLVLGGRFRKCGGGRGLPFGCDSASLILVWR